MGTYFDGAVNYHLEHDKIVTDIKDSGKNFTQLTITYSPYLLDAYYEPIVPFKDKVS
jgi:hypothetical protein